MAQINAEINLSGLSITGNQTVLVTVMDIYGVELTLCTATQDYTGVSLTEFINIIVACINTGSSGFQAFNESPVLRISRTDDIDTFIGTQADLTFGASNFNASFIKDQSQSAGCSPCYPYDLYSCYGSYMVDLGLPGSSSLKIIFTDKFGKEYIKSVSTESNGVFTIDPVDFPEGFFTPENGIITGTIKNVNNESVSFTVGYISYECLQINLTNMEQS